MRKHCAVFGFKRTMFVTGQAAGASESAANSGSIMLRVRRTLKITLKFKPGFKKKTKDPYGKEHEHSMIKNQYNQDISATQNKPIFSTV